MLTAEYLQEMIDRLHEERVGLIEKHATASDAVKEKIREAIDIRSMQTTGCQMVLASLVNRYGLTLPTVGEEEGTSAEAATPRKSNVKYLTLHDLEVGDLFTLADDPSIMEEGEADMVPSRVFQLKQTIIVCVHHRQDSGYVGTIEKLDNIYAHTKVVRVTQEFYPDSPMITKDSSGEVVVFDPTENDE